MLVGCSQPGHLAPERTPLIEATLYICIEHIFALLFDIDKDCCDRIVGTASRSETIAISFKQGFPLGFESLLGYCLTCPVEHDGYSERPLLSFSWFWYPDTSERPGFPLAHPFRVNGFSQGQSSSR